MWAWWHSVDWHGIGVFLLKMLAMYGVLSLAQLALRRRQFLRQSAVVFNLTFLFFSALVCIGPPVDGIPHFRDAVMAGFLFFGFCATIRILDAFLFEVVSRWRNRKPVPVVLRDILRWVVTLVALFFIIRIVFPDVNLNVIALSSIVVGYIVGNATQDTLGNLIAGLALNTERPFEIGDWVTVGGHTGTVVDMTWRATRLKTKNDDYIVIPNSTISREPIVNYSRPTQTHGLRCTFGASYDAPPKKVREVILGALATIPGVLQDPPPQVYLSAFGDSSVNYTVKYFIADFQHEDRIESDVMDLIWYHLRRARIDIPFPIRDVRLRSHSAADEDAQRARTVQEYAACLGRIDLFSGLSGDEVTALAARLHEELYGSGEALVKQGDAGDSFFIIKEGGVGVYAGEENGGRTEMARLGKDDFFGEMSLLTGEKRMATVVALTDTLTLVLTHDDLAVVMRQNEKLAEKLAAVLEHRSKALQDRLAVIKGAAPAPSGKASGGSLLQHIRNFFGLSGRA